MKKVIYSIFSDVFIPQSDIYRLHIHRLTRGATTW